MLSSYSVVLFWLYFCRCQKWVENCRRADLEDKTPDQLNKHYRLCAKHFETSMICRTVSKQRVCFFVCFVFTHYLVGNVNLYILMLESILTPCHFFFPLRWRQIWNLIVPILFLKSFVYMCVCVLTLLFLMPHAHFIKGHHFLNFFCSLQKILDDYKCVCLRWIWHFYLEQLL